MLTAKTWDFFHFTIVNSHIVKKREISCSLAVRMTYITRKHLKKLDRNKLSGYIVSNPS